MNIQIVYGDDSAGLDRYYLDMKSGFDELVNLETINPNLLEEKLGSDGLFASKRLFVCRNIFLNQVRVGKVSANLDRFLKIVAGSQKDILFIEEDAQKVKYYKKYFPRAFYKEFKSLPSLFYFLDGFKPHNLSKCFGYWRQSLVDNAPEMVFFHLKRRVRELINITSNAPLGNHQPWQLAKLRSQASAWDQKKLLLVYRAFFNYEKGLKSGTNPLNASQAVEAVMALYL